MRAPATESSGRAERLCLGSLSAEGFLRHNTIRFRAAALHHSVAAHSPQRLACAPAPWAHAVRSPRPWGGCLASASLLSAPAPRPDRVPPPAELDGVAALGGVQNGCLWSCMRHGKKIHRVGRPADQRKALLRALTTQVIQHGAIKTTVQKARAVRPWVDKMIVLAKAGEEAKSRQVQSFLYDRVTAAGLCEGAAERYVDRNNDFTRVSLPLCSLALADQPLTPQRRCSPPTAAAATTRRWSSLSCCRAETLSGSE